MANQFTIMQALIRLNCRGFSVSEDGTITYGEGIVPPSQGEIDAMVSVVEAEIPMNKLRNKRNRLLAETDWWASADLTMTPEQIAYRQALRDITNTYSSLDDVVWPTKPE